MTIESKATQAELRKRTTIIDIPPQRRRIDDALKTIMDGLHGKKRQGGEITYPYPLSPMDEIRIRQLAQRRFGNFALRIGEFTPIRLEESMGTIISIRKKGGRW